MDSYRYAAADDRCTTNDNSSSNSNSQNSRPCSLLYYILSLFRTLPSEEDNSMFGGIAAFLGKKNTSENMDDGENSNGNNKKRKLDEEDADDM